MELFQNGQHCGKFQTIDSLGYCGLFESKKQKQEALNNYWPNITFFLEGYDFVLTPNDYFFEYKDNNKIGACLGFEGERTSKITFGGTFMHGHDIIFDRENHRIGFVEADCNRGQLISDNQSDIILVKDNDTLLEDNEINDITKFNKIILIGIIIVSCILFVCIIILTVFIMRRKLNRRNYDVHVDESKEDLKSISNDMAYATKDGIKKDLTWMKRIGLGGFHHFDAGVSTPQIVENRLVYMDEGWKDAFAYATALADSLGLEMTVASAPGWSATGGPWVEPKDGMKKLVWKSVNVMGGKNVSLSLPEPYKTTGLFQNIPLQGNLIEAEGKPAEEYYEDIAVLAIHLKKPLVLKVLWNMHR